MVDTNPYTATDAAADEGLKTERFGCGSLIFLGLGLVVIGLPLLPVGFTIYRDGMRGLERIPAGILVIVSGLVLLGCFLVFHAFHRSQTTIGVLAIIFMAAAFLGLLFIIF